MDYGLKVQGGQIQFEDVPKATASDQREHFMEQFRAAVRIEDKSRRLNATAQVILPPILKVAPYLEWTQNFFMQRSEGPERHVRIAQDEYTALALYSSPDGGIEYVRPWRKYTTVSWRQIRAGLQIPWDADMWGWDMVSRKMTEVAEEFARRRDELRQPLLNAAAVSQAGHIPTVATTLSKASVDSIIQTSATNGFPVTQVAVNSGTLMDMTSWTLPSNSMIAGVVPEVVGRDILTRLYWNGYGGLTWIANHTIPSNYLYFSGRPANVGYQFMGPTRAASDVDIDHDLDKHNWRQQVAAHVEGSQWVWRLEIT